MPTIRGSRITHKVILYFHDDKHPKVVTIKDNLCEDRQAFEPKHEKDFGQRSTYPVLKRCSSKGPQKHTHNSHRRAHVVSLAESEATTNDQLDAPGKRMSRLPQRFKSFSPLNSLPNSRKATKRKGKSPTNKENERKRKQQNKAAVVTYSREILRHMENDSVVPAYPVSVDSTLKLQQTQQQLPAASSSTSHQPASLGRPRRPSRKSRRSSIRSSSALSPSLDFSPPRVTRSATRSPPRSLPRSPPRPPPRSPASNVWTSSPSPYPHRSPPPLGQRSLARSPRCTLSPLSPRATTPPPSRTPSPLSPRAPTPPPSPSRQQQHHLHMD